MTREDVLTECKELILVELCSPVVDETATDDDVDSTEISSLFGYLAETVVCNLFDTVVIVLVAVALN